MAKPSPSGIRAAFEYLLGSDDPVAKRYDHMLSNVSMMAAAGISELLARRDTTRWPAVTDRPMAGLVAFGVLEHSLPRSSHISRAQYQAFCHLLGELLAEVAREHPEFEDLLDLDFLLYHISMRVPIRSPAAIEALVAPLDDFEHEDVVDHVLELGDGLGFDVQKGVDVTHGCRIDAIWRSRIANLGGIAYAFEVHRRGSRDSAILNLQRVRRDPSVQKVIVVSSEGELRKFREEVWTLGEDFRNAVGYLSVDDLETALAHLEQVRRILKALGVLSAEPFSL